MLCSEVFSCESISENFWKTWVFSRSDKYGGGDQCRMLNFFLEGESAFFYLLWVTFSISK